MAGVSQDLFIEPGVNLQKGDKDLTTAVNLSKESLQNRWDTQKGKNILSIWKANNFDRSILDELVGKYYDHYDLRGITLINEDLSRVDLSSIDFFGANLENTSFEAADLTDSWLSESNLKGAKFDWAKMEQVLLDTVDFDQRTSFVGVNLNGINFTLAALLRDLALGQQRIVHLEKRHPLFAKFLRITCDYGRSFTRYVIWCLAVILLFGLLYYFLPGSISETGFWNSLYFSVVTFTTSGYGDIRPMFWVGRILVVVEVITGYVMAGLLIAILARRIIGD